MLFVNFSSAFNTISSIKLIEKLWAWVQHSAAGYLNSSQVRPQTVQIGSHTSSTLVLNSGAPQGWVLSPLIFTLNTHDCIRRIGRKSPTKHAGTHTISWIGKKLWEFISGGNQQSWGTLYLVRKITWFGFEQHGWKLSRGLVGNIQWFHSHSCWNSVLNWGHWLGSSLHL